MFVVEFVEIFFFVAVEIFEAESEALVFGDLREGECGRQVEQFSESALP